ncbi:MAG: hypothetical protein OXC07_02125 [Kistimonas sp.]|nr:hypothetical protein [Kistimonas sp.]
MKKTTRQFTKVNLMSWAAVIGLGLMSMQAPAFASVQPVAADSDVLATELEEAITLTGKLVGAQTGECRSVPLDDGAGQGVSFKVECPGGTLRLERQLKSRANAYSYIRHLLTHELPPGFSSVVLQPIAELKREAEGDRKIPSVYTVHPWIEDPTLDDLLKTMAQSGFDPERLQSIYSQIGTLLGIMHSVDAFYANDSGVPTHANMMYSQLSGKTLRVMAQDKVVMQETDNFFLHPKDRPKSVHGYLRDDLPGLLRLDNEFLRNSPVSSAWLAVLPGITEALVTSYCQALVSEDRAAACAYQVARTLDDEARNLYRWNYSPENIGRQELASRLEAVFGQYLGISF